MGIDLRRCADFRGAPASAPVSWIYIGLTELNHCYRCTLAAVRRRRTQEAVVPLVRTQRSERVSERLLSAALDYIGTTMFLARSVLNCFDRVERGIETRKLAAILAADLVSYSRLAGVWTKSARWPG
jgi:hypothetical protein